jgi:hypothetical protein
LNGARAAPRWPLLANNTSDASRSRRKEVPPALPGLPGLGSAGVLVGWEFFDLPIPQRAFLFVEPEINLKSVYSDQQGQSHMATNSLPLPVLRWLPAVVAFFLLLGSSTARSEVLFRDDFNHLDNWAQYTFKNIARQTLYRIEKHDGSQALVATSSASASALISTIRFSVEEHPILRWRWKVDNLYTRGNYRQKSGDDYPMRVYVVFEYHPERADFGTKVRYQLAKTLYGQYPPHSSLNYIWANRADEQETVANPFTERAMMIPLQYGEENVGRWVEERVNVYQDYLKAFGEPPPPVASLAIMSDSDNTGESATAYLDFIEIGTP